MFRWLHDLLCRNSPTHAMLRVIEANIMCHPEEWTADQFEAWNERRQIKIWIANSAYGLDVYDGLNRHRCPKIHLPTFWKRRLWSAWRGKGFANGRHRQIVSRFDDRLSASDNVVSLHK